MNKIKFIIGSFLIWRLLLFIPLIVSEKILEYRIGYDYANIWKFINPYFPVSNPFFYPWANFDGVHYLLIAGNGYTNNLEFFPLFPLIIRIVSFLFGTTQTFGIVQFFTAFFISNNFFLLSIFVFYALIRLDYSKKIAQLSIIFLLLFPTSFYFGSIYGESLFLFLSLSCFYFIRKKQWTIASILGALLTLTRIVGIFILIPLILEFIKKEKINKKQFLKLFLNILSFLLIPISLIGYSLFNFWRTGDFLYFVHAHGNLGNGRAVNSIILMPQTLFRYGKILFSVSLGRFEWWIALLELSIFLIVSILLCISWRQKIRLSYILFTALCFLTPALSGTFSGLPRYSLILFPIFISLALIKNIKIQIAYGIISAILLFILLMFFSKGYFIA